MLSKPSAYTPDVTPDELRAWREEHGISQSELASALEIHAHTVSKWEIGINRPPPYLGLALRGIEAGKPQRRRNGRRP